MCVSLNVCYLVCAFSTAPTALPKLGLQSEPNLELVCISDLEQLLKNTLLGSMLCTCTHMHIAAHIISKTRKRDRERQLERDKRKKERKERVERTKDKRKEWEENTEKKNWKRKRERKRASVRKWEREKRLKNEKTSHVIQKRCKGLRKWRGKKEKRRLKRRRTKRALPLISSDLISKIIEGETGGRGEEEENQQ